VADDSNKPPRSSEEVEETRTAGAGEQLARDEVAREHEHAPEAEERPNDESAELGSFRSPRERRESRKRGHHHPRSRRGPLDAWLERLMVAVVAGSVLAIGTVHVPTLLVVGTASIGAGVLAMVVYRRDMRVWPITLPLAGVMLLTLWTLVQAIPLPSGLAASIAPRNAEIWAHALDPLGLHGPSWHPISLDPGATWVEVLKGLTYAGMILASTVVAYRRSATFGVATVFFSALAAALFTIAHGLTGMTKVFGIYDPIHNFSAWHIGPLLNANHLAGYLNLGAMCGLGVLLMRKTRVPRWVAGLGVATIIAVTVTSASRGAVVLLPVGVAIVVVLMRSRSERIRRESVSNRWLNILTIGAVLGGMALAGLGATTRQWDELLSEDLSKLSIMEWAQPLIADHTWLGIGRGAFETVYPAYRPNAGHLLWTHPENLAIQWAAEWGVPAAILAGIFFAWLIRPSRMGATRSAVAAGAVGGILVLVLQNWVDFSIEMPGVSIAVVVLIGSCWGDTRRRGVARWAREKKGTASQLLRKVGIGLGKEGSRSDESPVRNHGLAVAFGAIGVAAVVMAGVKGMPTALQDRMAFHEIAKGPKMPAAKFEPLVRQAMLRHPAEPYFSLVGAERAWRVRDENPIPYLQRVFTRAKLYGRAHLLLAEILFARGAKDQALMELKYACRDEKGLASSAVPLAIRFTEHGDDLAKMVPEGEHGARVLDTLGAWLHTRAPHLGKRFDEMALERDPTLVAPRARRASNLIAALRDEERPECGTEKERRRCADLVEKHAARIEKHEPDTSRAARLRASALMALGKPEDANTLLETACEHVRDRYSCLRARVPILASLDRDEELEKLLNATATAGCTGGKACSRAYKWVGDFQRRRKNLGGAASAYAKSTRHDPQNAGAWVRLGDVSMALGTHAQATRAYERAVKLRPEDEGLRKKLEAAREGMLGGLILGR